MKGGGKVLGEGRPWQ